MDNSDILAILELTAKLLELHGENDFKVRTYQSAVFLLDKTTLDLTSVPQEELTKMPGVGKSMAAKIVEIRTTGDLAELQEWLSRTPDGVVEMLDIKGIGPKKVRQIWLDLGIADIRELILACENGEVAKLKGFGDKTQETIKKNLLYKQSNAAKLRMDKAEMVAQLLLDALEKHFSDVEIVGEIRRKCEIVSLIQLLVASPKPWEVQQVINALPFAQQNEKASSPFVWRGKLADYQIPIEVLVCSTQSFQNQAFIYSAAAEHLAHRVNGKSVLQVANAIKIESEEQVYEQIGVPYIIPEMREGRMEFDWVTNHQNEELVTWDALKGILHNHSTYSDGKHSLADMASYCKELGFEYLGIADHSKSATYAKGLQEYRIEEQHKEIGVLNQQLAPFKILKGIESDILGDGSLDYSDEVLATFDYVVASVHSNLKMDFNKATQRLLRAIENPFTTILGHPTGRLLLSREGYPIDYKAIINACAKHNVVIEINASPYRLDLDWRWIQYCLDQGVKLSINPDAHEKAGYFDMHYGVAVARKGGLTTKMTFNALTLKEIEAYLKQRNSNKLAI